MKKETILYGVIGLLAGAIIAGFSASYAVNNNNNGMMRMMGMNNQVMDRMYPSGHGEMSMAEMSVQLKDKSGDDFDKAFIEMMIAHHQGAIDMAKLVDGRAQHNEIKQLSKVIIGAQTKEISDMKQWQQDWGYTDGDVMQMMH